jgi:succinate dehydrogenase cytochrome b556 subunit
MQLMHMTQPTPAKAQGVWAWILQRLSAVLLFVLLGTHLAVLHYVDENLVITFAGVAARMKSVLYLIVDGGLLSVGLYHALNGLRAVIFDFGFGESVRRAITYMLLVVGVAFLLWGTYALAAFLQ